jgi:hypothetical protein
LAYKRRRGRMNNVIAFHPAKYDLVNLYEVTDSEGIAQWGGEKPHEAVDWYQRSPIGSRVLVSAWSSDEEDAVLIGQAIDITHIINQAIAKGKGE